ncbi:hypothetical protein BDN70DRAFT_880037 [Pholiota conissans]|uniref:Uncharacterized protein n=1 Tax=Pholiota conissans TaxID=109636 RepID=A0A9P5Z140_9AGAR|nr:hypothetical protein BDN70DRAFT_880037 [Pholiota conissans]
MGIFNVSFSTAYGEDGPRVFFRLLQEILASSADVTDIFNWGGLHDEKSLIHESRILPSCLQQYLCRSADESLVFRRPTKPLTITHLGLRVPVILMPAMSITKPATAYNSRPMGDYSATVDIFPPGKSPYSGIPCTYHLLNSRVSGLDGNKGIFGGEIAFQVTFSVLNFTRNANRIWIPKTCIAKVLRCY